MPVLGSPRSYHRKFKFVVEIDGFSSAGFQKCSELTVEVANIEYHEGGSLVPHKSPGRLKFTDVTLERGASQDKDFYSWVSEVANAAANAGLSDPSYKRTIDIVQQDRDGSTLRRWTLSNAWPVKYSAGAWDNESDETVIESLTLTYDFFTLA